MDSFKDKYARIVRFKCWMLAGGALLFLFALAILAWVFFDAGGGRQGNLGS